MPIANLASVVRRGILSYDQAAKLQHESVAMHSVQDRRDAKSVPQGLRLHQYANLYFDARNPMMYKRRTEAAALCVLAVSRRVLAMPGVVLADCNAASPYARFLDPKHWELIDFDDVFATSWWHPDDPIRLQQHRLRKCAEVLVPHCIKPDMIQGAYVVSSAVQMLVAAEASGLPTRIVPDMFFQ